MYELAQILDSRAWLRRSWPFPHVTARDVFQAEFYAVLASQLAQILRRGLSEAPSRESFGRNIPGYDAYGLGFTAGTEGPLSVFVSPAWRDLLCSIFGVGRTPYVYAGAHHHKPGSSAGFIHNDFNPVWFPRVGGAAIQAPENDLCSYMTGAGRLGDDEKTQVVRGAVMLFYLFNDGWRTGDGGETALYTSDGGPIASPAVAYPPVNNSLVAFECTPRSFHTFMSNRRVPRTSIIMWVHRTMEEAAAMYGEGQLKRWHA